MESNFLLVQAASGLERLMVGSSKNAVLKDSLVAQISAAIYYKAHVVSNLTKSTKLKNAFQKIIFTQIEEDFGLYMDSQARTKPKTYHHVYEWKKAGIKEFRLFELKQLPVNDMSVKLTYRFNKSSSLVPSSNSDRRHVFANKAAIMEEGKPLKISPRYAERLVFESDIGYTVFMKKGESVTVNNPGGVAVQGSFEAAYKKFFSGNLVNLSIKKSGFQKIFSATALKALSLPTDIRRVKYSFSPMSIKSMAISSSSGAAI